MLLECLLLSAVTNTTCGVRDSDEFFKLLDVGQDDVGAINGQREERQAKLDEKEEAIKKELDKDAAGGVAEVKYEQYEEISGSDEEGKELLAIRRDRARELALSRRKAEEEVLKEEHVEAEEEEDEEIKSNITGLNSSAMVGTRFDALHLSASMIFLADGTGMVDVLALLEGAMSAVGLGADAADLGAGGGMLVLGGHAKKVKGWEKAHHLGGAANFIGWAGLAVSGYDTYTAGRDLVQAWQGGQANGCELTVHGVHLTVAGGGFAAGLLGQFCMSDHSGTIAGAAAAASGLLWSAVEDKLLSWCRDGQPQGGQNMQLPVMPDGSQMTLQQATQIAAGSAYAPVPPSFAGGSQSGLGWGAVGMGSRLNPVQTAFGFGQSPVGGAPLVGLRWVPQGSAGNQLIMIPGMRHPGGAAHPHGCPAWSICQVRTLQCTPAGCNWVVRPHPC